MGKNWMKIVGICLLIGGCSSSSSWNGYTAKQSEQLKAAGIDQETAESCKNPSSLISMSKGKIIKKYSKQYCSVNMSKSSPKIVNAVLKANGSAEQAKAFGEVKYAWEENAGRYVAYAGKEKQAKDIVLKVNMNLDKPYYTDVKTISDTDDSTMLVNKYQKLPVNYEPKDLVETPAPCTNEYSCFPDKQYIVKAAAVHFQQLIDAAEQKGFTITAIASLRGYQYQEMLYNYYAQANGVEYADTYYARPGQSEHNTGLAVDITIDHMDYTEIEKSPHYDWLLKHMADYGFILRYPKDKEDVTGFGYESWHLRYVGKHAAKSIMDQGITLDEYHAMKVKE